MTGRTEAGTLGWPRYHLLGRASPLRSRLGGGALLRPLQTANHGPERRAQLFVAASGRIQADRPAPPPDEHEDRVCLSRTAPCTYHHPTAVTGLVHESDC